MRILILSQASWMKTGMQDKVVHRAFFFLKVSVTIRLRRTGSSCVILSEWLCLRQQRRRKGNGTLKILLQRDGIGRSPSIHPLAWLISLSMKQMLASVSSPIGDITFYHSKWKMEWVEWSVMLRHPFVLGLTYFKVLPLWPFFYSHKQNLS